jgi:hypothetical protein
MLIARRIGEGSVVQATRAGLLAVLGLAVLGSLPGCGPGKAVKAAGKILGVVASEEVGAGKLARLARLGELRPAKEALPFVEAKFFSSADVVESEVSVWMCRLKPIPLESPVPQAVEVVDAGTKAKAMLRTGKEVTKYLNAARVPAKLVDHPSNDREDVRRPSASRGGAELVPAPAGSSASRTIVEWIESNPLASFEPFGDPRIDFTRERPERNGRDWVAREAEAAWRDQVRRAGLPLPALLVAHDGDEYVIRNVGPEPVFTWGGPRPRGIRGTEVADAARWLANEGPWQRVYLGGSAQSRLKASTAPEVARAIYADLASIGDLILVDDGASATPQLIPCVQDVEGELLAQPSERLAVPAGALRLHRSLNLGHIDGSRWRKPLEIVDLYADPRIQHAIGTLTMHHRKVDHRDAHIVVESLTDAIAEPDDGLLLVVGDFGHSKFVSRRQFMDPVVLDALEKTAWHQVLETEGPHFLRGYWGASFQVTALDIAQACMKVGRDFVIVDCAADGESDGRAELTPFHLAATAIVSESGSGFCARLATEGHPVILSALAANPSRGFGAARVGTNEITELRPSPPEMAQIAFGWESAVGHLERSGNKPGTDGQTTLERIRWIVLLCVAGGGAAGVAIVLKRRRRRRVAQA